MPPLDGLREIFKLPQWTGCEEPFRIERVLASGGTGRVLELLRAGYMGEIDRGAAEEARDILRIEFEHASHMATELGNLGDTIRFLQLAATVKDIDASLLEAYSELFDGLTDVEVSSEMFRRIGLSWFPTTATEFVTKFIAVRTGGHF